ncbi:unnamed protein product [Fraxinus pennsylvanica]|uniref:Uncharacterized protein n=1 Tax=Fraxinus pennsylvanica TaxID=56036 RepID=A0AAD2DQ94_9LAMI|nr:unnamed protein product [Fraxinus pennsylvanica]
MPPWLLHLKSKIVERVVNAQIAIIELIIVIQALIVLGAEEANCKGPYLFIAPNVISSEDNEHTIEEDEGLITKEEREELPALQNEIDLSVEELLKHYAAEEVIKENRPENIVPRAIEVKEDNVDLPGANESRQENGDLPGATEAREDKDHSPGATESRDDNG